MAVSKEQVYAVLEEKGFEYRVEEHPAVFTMEDMERELKDGAKDVVKNAFLRDAKKKHWYLVLMQEGKSLDMAKLQSTIRSTRLSFASAEYLMERLGVAPGAVSPLAILNDTDHIVEVLVDEALAKKDIVGVHPCDNTATVFMKTKDLEQLIKDNGNSVKTIKI